MNYSQRQRFPSKLHFNRNIQIYFIKEIFVVALKHYSACGLVPLPGTVALYHSSVELCMKKISRNTQLKERIDRYLDKSLQEAPSETNNNHLTVVNCLSYYCPFSRKCANKTERPSKIPIRKCLRFTPKDDTAVFPLSEFALDLLSVQEQKGEPISKQTKLLLDKYRPNGPLKQRI